MSLAYTTQYIGTGRRKVAIARVRLVPGTGVITVNRRPLEEYFSIKTMQAMVVQPLRLTAMLEKYDVLANVRGGGISGQAGAMRHGIARALLRVDESLRKTIKKAGFLTRDPRIKERRKYGLRKARKAPQWAKR